MPTLRKELSTRTAGNSTATLKNYLDSRRRMVDQYLRGALYAAYGGNPHLYRPALHSAIAIAKRTRPLLTIATAEMFGRRPDSVLPVAVSIELIHISSCIIDDLPSADNSEEREGRPSTHSLFGEGTTILTAVALISNAYQIITNLALMERLSLRSRCALVTLTSETIRRMSLGQLTELRLAPNSKRRSSHKAVNVHKTGALFEAAIRAGAISCGASSKDTDILAQYGLQLGLAYQLADDLADSADDGGRAGSGPRNLGHLMEDALAGLKTLKRDSSLLHRVGLYILGAKLDE